MENKFDKAGNLPHLLNPKVRKIIGATVEQEGKKLIGTPDYLSPEIITGISSGPTVDWWALGVITFEFLTGVAPFSDETPEKIFKNILNLDIPWPRVPEEMSPVAQDFISKLLQIFTEDRLTGAENIKAHPFFKGIDWGNLYSMSMSDIFIPQPVNMEDTFYFCKRKNSGCRTYIYLAPGAVPSVVGSWNSRNNGKKRGDATAFSGFHYTNTQSLESKNLAILRNRSSSDAGLSKEEMAKRKKQLELSIRRHEVKSALDKMDLEKLREFLDQLIDKQDSFVQAAYATIRPNDPSLFVKCKICFQKFNPYNNLDNSCCWHPGEIDYEQESGGKTNKALFKANLYS